MGSAFGKCGQARRRYGYGEGWPQNAGRAHYLRNRKRRFFVSRFRNERRRLERFWKHTELARYLLERLLLVGPMQGRVVEAVHDGRFDDFKIGRNVEIARHVERGVADMQDFATRLP